MVQGLDRPGFLVIELGEGAVEYHGVFVHEAHGLVLVLDRRQLRDRLIVFEVEVHILVFEHVEGLSEVCGVLAVVNQGAGARFIHETC